jgi:hypothetical protein
MRFTPPTWRPEQSQSIPSPRPLAFRSLGHSLVSIPENGDPSRIKDFRMLESRIGIRACKASALPLSYAPGSRASAGTRNPC